MHRFYLSPERVSESELTLDERESHHAAIVLRVREGERVAVLDEREMSLCARRPRWTSGPRG